MTVMHRVLVTGSRAWPRTEAAAIFDVLDALRDAWSGLVIVHGAHRLGVDRIADEWCWHRRVPVQRYPADWERLGYERAGVIRNRQMVATRPAECVAFRWPGISAGTDDCVEVARHAGLAVTVYRPGERAEVSEQLVLEPV